MTKMMLVRALGAALVLMTVGPVGTALGQTVDPFYAARLEEGVQAYESGDFERAAEELRIAAFGLLDSPQELARALTRLAPAQAAIGEAEGAATTRRRLSELEARFGRGVVALAQPSPPDAAPAEESEADAPPEAPPADRAPSRTDSVAKAPPRLCVSWSGDGDCSSQPAAASDPGGPSIEEQGAVARLADTATGKASARKLTRALEEARPLAARYPDWTELQRVTARLAARTGAHEEAVHHFEGSGPLDEDPIDRYYFALALYETGRTDEAAATLREVLPQLDQNREVRRNVKRILSTQSPA